MKICRTEFLDKVLKKFKDSGIIIIFDEVMTGFGRTGKMFAADYLKIKPDIICLAKSLTGGYLPLAATVFSKKFMIIFLVVIFLRLSYMVTLILLTQLLVHQHWPL